MTTKYKKHIKYANLKKINFDEVEYKNINFRDVMQLWPVPRNPTLAHDLTIEMEEIISCYTIASWKKRNHIPSEYWKYFITCAKRYEKWGHIVNAELLMELAAAHPKRMKFNF